MQLKFQVNFGFDKHEVDLYYTWYKLYVQIKFYVSSRIGRCKNHSNMLFYINSTSKYHSNVLFSLYLSKIVLVKSHVPFGSTRCKVWSNKLLPLEFYS